MSKIVNIDLDNTIANTFTENIWPEIGNPIKGAREALRKMKEEGYYIRVFSCRTSEEVFKYSIDRQEQVRKIEDYLKEHEISFDEVLNINKPLGIIIDDSAIGFRGDWKNVIDELEKM